MTRYLSPKIEEIFVEIVQLLAEFNPEIASVVLENAPQNANYTSPDIQKEILSVFAMNVRKHIREEIGDAKFSILVDKTCDVAEREQMALVFRFVDSHGVLQEPFFDLIHVKNTKAMTLKKELSKVLSSYAFDVQNLRGQGYDGAGNMKGELNGLQALFLKRIFASFNASEVCKMVEKYYPTDFNQQERLELETQLNHFVIDASSSEELKNITTIAELCRCLVDTGRNVTHNLIDRLLRLLRTLPVSTASAERVFSILKIIKTRLRNKMEDEFLANSLLAHIEGEIARCYSDEDIISVFQDLKKRRVDF
ncbi:uncharacterized protein [Miscanthus floridulus]|uniref:uncharacterized protein n=1 Tax=Miscanthus floridulus TaxID=154761 RepID=UPI00345A4FCA